MLMTPGGEDQVIALANNLQDPTWVSDLTNLVKLLLSPTIAITTFGLLSIPVPIIEEVLKTLAAGVVARWARPHPARAFLWGVTGGAGFALVENVFNGALGGGVEGWAIVAVARFGATMMHCMTGGLVGWGWGQLWTERRPLRLLGCYVAAVIVHGMWNAITMSAVFLSASVLVLGGNDVWPAIAGLAILIVLGLLGLLTVTFVFALPLVGRKLATDIKQLQTETAGLE
jgi:RsiW-degrading membrane proteinase PrsW (M82 family)